MLVLIWLLPGLLAIVMHELAHGLSARYMGDNSAQQAGRLSLNPLRHLDPLGSLLVPAVLYLFTQFLFGWARPVPVDAVRLQRNMVWVALAGPAANLIMLFAWALCIKLGLWLQTADAAQLHLLILLGAAGVFINSAVMMLNLLPLPPLDGGRVLMALMPNQAWLHKFEPWGLPLLILLLLSGLMSKILWPLMALVMAAGTWLSNLPPGLLIEALRELL